MDEDNKSAAKTKRQEPFREEEKSLTTPRSLGERLSPLLVIAMQCCLVYTLLLVLAGFLPGSSGPLLPIWAVFLVFFCLYWLSDGLKRFVSQYLEPRLQPVFCQTLPRVGLGCAVLICLVFCIWLHFYAQEFSLFNLAWFQALNSAPDPVERDLQILVLGFLLCILAWLSYQTTKDRANAALLLSKGSPLMVILAAISLGEGLLKSSSDFWQAALLLPIFYWLGLTAQALQKASVKRRYYSANLTEGTRHQERIIFQVMALLGLVVIVAGLAMIFIRGDLVTYSPRVNSVKGLLPTPQTLIRNGEQPTIEQPSPLSPTFLSRSEIIGSAVAAGIVGIFIVSLFWVFLRLWLTRKKRIRKKRSDRDERKSLWSWSLFLAQCKALFCALLAFLKLMRQRTEMSESESAGDIYLAPPEIRSMREVYQTFLQTATRQGYPRAKDETPYEFQHRLHEQRPLLEPELEAITQAYTLARYGGSIPHMEDITRAKEFLGELKRKWP
jgi:hypothetical protein